MSMAYNTIGKKYSYSVCLFDKSSFDFFLVSCVQKMTQEEKKMRSPTDEEQVEELCRHPHILEIVEKLADSVVDQALALPILQWMEDAQAAGFTGVIWFRYDMVNGTDVLTMLGKRKNPFPTGWIVAHQEKARVMLVYKGPEERIVPIVRAVISPAP